MNMEHHFERPTTPATSKEEAPLTNKEQILSALRHSLDGEALSTWMAMMPAGAPVSSFIRWVDEFNSASPEDRGKGKYDHSRTLEKNIDITEVIKTGSGFDVEVTLHKNGEITLAPAL